MMVYTNGITHYNIRLFVQLVQFNCNVLSRCKYELQLCPRLTNGKTAADLQKIDVLVPGAPDAPTIWQRSVSSNEFVIEWAEPKLYLCKLIGYQVNVQCMLFSYCVLIIMLPCHIHFVKHSVICPIIFRKLHVFYCFVVMSLYSRTFK